MKPYPILAVAILTTVISQLLFKRGISGFSEAKLSWDHLWILFRFILTDGYLLTGLGFYGVSFVLWLFVLTKLDLSLVYPMTSLNFVLVALFSWLLLGEQLDLGRILGIGLIVVGVVFLFKSA